MPGDAAAEEVLVEEQGHLPHLASAEEEHPEEEGGAVEVGQQQKESQNPGLWKMGMEDAGKEVLR